MADRKRDLTFAVLSDLDNLRTDAAARDLDDLGKAAEDAGRKVDDLSDTADRSLDDLADSAGRAGKAVGDLSDRASRSDLDQVERDAKDGSSALDDFERNARDVARRVGDAFDTITKGSHQTFSKDIDDDLGRAKRGLNDFKEEAHSSGREAAASFGGGFDDVGSFVQETAANAFGGFGPLGAAAGTIAAVGIGIATKAIEDAKQRAQEAKEDIKEFFDAFVEGQGRITEQSIQSRLSDLLGDPDQYKKIRDEAAKAGVAVELYARALAGDPDAVARLREEIEQTADVTASRYNRAFANAVEQTGDLADKQRGILDPTKSMAELTGQAAAAQNRQSDALGKVGGKLDDVSDRLGDATSAYNVLKDATRAGITIGIKAPSPRELDEINRRIRSGVGEIVIPLKVGQPRNENNANNSRYRW